MLGNIIGVQNENLVYSLFKVKKIPILIQYQTNTYFQETPHETPTEDLIDRDVSEDIEIPLPPLPAAQDKVLY